MGRSGAGPIDPPSWLRGALSAGSSASRNASQVTSHRNKALGMTGAPVLFLAAFALAVAAVGLSASPENGLQAHRLAVWFAQFAYIPTPKIMVIGKSGWPTRREK